MINAVNQTGDVHVVDVPAVRSEALGSVLLLAAAAESKMLRRLAHEGPLVRRCCFGLQLRLFQDRTRLVQSADVHEAALHAVLRPRHARVTPVAPPNEPHGHDHDSDDTQHCEEDATNETPIQCQSYLFVLGNA